MGTSTDASDSNQSRRTKLRPCNKRFRLLSLSPVATDTTLIMSLVLKAAFTRDQFPDQRHRQLRDSDAGSVPVP
jgi:hypothetical protein